MGVQARSGRAPSEAELAQLVHSRAHAAGPACEGGSPGAELLAEAHGHGVLQVRPSGLDHVVELRGPPRAGGAAAVGGSGELQRPAQPGEADGGRDHVVRRLAEVHVVVRMDARPVAATEAEDLVRARGDHLIGVHVQGGAGAGVEGVDDELLPQASVHDLAGGLGDGPGRVGFDQPQLGIGPGGRELDGGEGADQLGVGAQTAEREVPDGPRRLGPVVGVGGDGHRSHRVADFTRSHAARSFLRAGLGAGSGEPARGTAASIGSAAAARRQREIARIDQPGIGCRIRPGFRSRFPAGGPSDARSARPRRRGPGVRRTAGHPLPRYIARDPGSVREPLAACSRLC